MNHNFTKKDLTELKNDFIKEIKKESELKLDSVGICSRPFVLCGKTVVYNLLLEVVRSED